MFHQLQCMRSFVNVADNGSFSRAAHAMQIGAASISEHIGNLERHLGASLFHRTTRSLRLTHEGKRYLAHCRDVLARIDEMDQQLARGGGEDQLTGLLRIEMADGVDAFLLDAVRSFQERHGALNIHILRSNRPFDLAEGIADIMIRSIAPFDGGRDRLVSQIMGQSRTTFLASPAYLDRFGEPLTPEDLMRHRCIGYVDPASGRLWEWYFGTPDDGVFSMDLPCPLAMAQGELRRRAAVAGFGIINDIDHFTAPLVQQGLLTPMLARWTMPQPICHVSYPGDRYRSGRINAFLAHLKQWFARQPPSGT